MMILNPLLGPLIHLNGARPLLQLRKSLRSPRAVQENLLRSILASAQDSTFGRDHMFASLAHIRDFQSRVPVQSYETLSPYLDRVVAGETEALLSPRDRILMFGLTSGSTGTPKRIPVTQTYVSRFKKTYRLWSSLSLRAHPEVLKGTFFALFSDWKEEVTDQGIPCGAVTGLIAQLQTPWIKRRMTLPLHLALLKDPAIRERTALHHALSKKVSVFTAANPSSLLRLCKRLDKEIEPLLRGLCDGRFSHLKDLPEAYRALPDFRPQPARARRLAREVESMDGRALPEILWPESAMVACWMGGTLSPYLEALREYFPTTPFRDPGLVASEGRFTVPFEDETSSGYPDLSGVLFEFYPAENESEVPVGHAEKLLLPWELEVGRIYHLIFTTGWGLYRYDIGDLVEVTGYAGEVPIIRFLRKSSGYASITGEKLTEDQLVAAFAKLPHDFQGDHGDFLLVPKWGDPPGYVLVIEAKDAREAEQLERRARELDTHLRELNLEYESKRASGRLACIRPLPVAVGTFETLRRREIQKAGGRAEQYKLKRIRGDYESLATLESFCLHRQAEAV